MSVQEAAVSLLQRVLFYVGIDWAAETHAVCVLDATGRIRAQFTIGHTAAGFADLLARLARLTGDPAEVAVGIERPDGRLVDVLLEAGYPVVPVSPNAIKTWRDGRAAGSDQRSTDWSSTTDAAGTSNGRCPSSLHAAERQADLVHRSRQQRCDV